MGMMQTVVHETRIYYSRWESMPWNYTKEKYQTSSTNKANITSMKAHRYTGIIWEQYNIDTTDITSATETWLP